MSTVQDLKDAIDAERAQVAQAFQEMSDQIQALKDQIADGQVVSQADLDAMVEAVRNIYTPPPAAEVPSGTDGEQQP